jgi:hypothetical protein
LLRPPKLFPARGEWAGWLDEGRFEPRDGTGSDVERASDGAFEQAVMACQDPFAIEWIDESEDYGEQRISLLGGTT